MIYILDVTPIHYETEMESRLWSSDLRCRVVLQVITNVSRWSPYFSYVAVSSQTPVINAQANTASQHSNPQDTPPWEFQISKTEGNILQDE
jgi:hypothetical protein